MCHLIAFHLKMMGYMMYLNQALKQDHSTKFVKAIMKEVNSQFHEKHWELIPQVNVPPDLEEVPSV